MTHKLNDPGQAAGPLCAYFLTCRWMEMIVHTSIIGLFQDLATNIYLQHLQKCQKPEQVLYNLLYSFMDSAGLLCQVAVPIYMPTSGAQNHWDSSQPWKVLQI